MTDELHIAPDAALAGTGSEPSAVGTVVFSEAAGVGDDVAASILADATQQVASSRIGGVVRRVRFVPSTRVEVEGGFQVLADTTVQSGRRSIVLGSVVTVEGEADHQVLKDFTIRGL